MRQVPVIEFRDVGLCYQRRHRLRRNCAFWALQDVSFDVRRGETLGVIGRNGTGKSTLLKLIAGIIEPDRGTITRGAERASLLSLQVGFIPYLTGRQNAVLSGILLGMRRKEIEGRMPAIVEFSELGEFIDQPLNTYSAGMRARLGFAVAFQASPEILLVDEVVGVGDIQFRRKSSEAMKELIKSEKTVVLVSHDLKLVTELCDRALWIEHGKIRALGTVAAVIAEFRAAMQRPAA